MGELSIDLRELQILPLENKERIWTRHTQISPFYEARIKLNLDLFVGFCFDRAKDMYIIGVPDVCSFLSGNSIEEALSVEYEKVHPETEIPDFCKLIEWAKENSVLDATHTALAHEVRGKRNDYGHAFGKILRQKLKRSRGRKPFTDQEAFDTFSKALSVLKYLYEK